MERGVNFYDLEQIASVDFNKQWLHAERAISIEISARHCAEENKQLGAHVSPWASNRAIESCNREKANTTNTWYTMKHTEELCAEKWDHTAHTHTHANKADSNATHLRVQINAQFSQIVTSFLEPTSWAHGVVVSHLIRIQKALGSIPSVSSYLRTIECGSCKSLFDYDSDQVAPIFGSSGYCAACLKKALSTHNMQL